MASETKTKIKFLTYNVWSREHVAVYRRICAISELIEQLDLDVIFLQLSKLAVEEVVYVPLSPLCYLTSPRSSLRSPPRITDTVHTRLAVAGPLPPDLLSNWVYRPRCTEEKETRNHYFWQPATWRQVRAATCCLPGKTPWDVRSMHRRGRAGLFLEHFDVNGCENVVLGGDLSWDDDVDGPLPLGNGWVDAWSELRGGEGPGGWTYNALANPMLRGCKPERKRPDRFVCKLMDFRLESIEMVGDSAWNPFPA